MEQTDGGQYCARAQNLVSQIQAKRRLADGDALDIEDQVRVGRNVRGSTLLSVCKRCWNGKTALRARGHAGDTNVPALDDLAYTELEREWLALFVGYRMVSMCIVLKHGGETYSQIPCRS